MRQFCTVQCFSRCEPRKKCLVGISLFYIVFLLIPINFINRFEQVISVNESKYMLFLTYSMVNYCTQWVSFDWSRSSKLKAGCFGQLQFTRLRKRCTCKFSIILHSRHKESDQNVLINSLIVLLALQQVLLGME